MQSIALLESQNHGGRAGAGSAASIALHVVLLALAIAATSHNGQGKRESPVYIPLPRWRPQVQMVLQPATRTAPIPTPRVPAISVAIPTVVPTSIPGPSTPVVTPTTVGTPTVPVAGGNTGLDSSVGATRGTTPFSDFEVDVPASVLAGQRGPAYPEGLRMIGVEGRVVARFIIGKNGRVESDPTILSSTADEFAASVRRYLAGAKYKPATVNGEPVRQLAEQEFNFTVRR